MKNEKKSRMIFRFFVMVCGMVLWAMIEALELGSFMFIFPAALILFSFDKIRKEVMSEVNNCKPIADSVRVVKVKTPVIESVADNYLKCENSECFQSQNSRIEICV